MIFNKSSQYLFGLVGLAAAAMTVTGFTSEPELARYDRVKDVKTAFLTSVLKTPKFTSCSQLTDVLSKFEDGGYGAGYGGEPSYGGYGNEGDYSGYGSDTYGGYAGYGGDSYGGYGYEPYGGNGNEYGGYSGYEPYGGGPGCNFNVRNKKLVWKVQKKLLQANHSMGCGLEGSIKSTLR